MIEYIIKKQYVNGKSGIKILAIRDGKIIGNTGFVEYTKTAYSHLNIGEIEYEDEVFSLFVDECERKNGIGKNLVEKLVQETQKVHKYLLIPNTTKNSRTFYKKVLSELKNDKIITDFEEIGRFPPHMKDLNKHQKDFLVSLNFT